MAEKLEIVAQVKIDASIANANIQILNDKIKETNKALVEAVKTFGAGSDEAKKLAEDVVNLESEMQKLKTSAKGVDEPIKDLKKQLSEANKELLLTIQNFGEGSIEAKNAAEKVNQLGKKIKDAKELTDTFNPGAKFQALAGAIQGAAGAFTAITALQAQFGKESEVTNQALLKVQSAMALSQGITSVLESKKSFEDLGKAIKATTIFQKVSTAAQFLWNAAMEANPIGAIVAAVAALVAGLILLVSWLKSSAAEAKAQAKAVDDNKKAVDNLNKSLDKNSEQFDKNQAQQLAMAKASGKSAEEIRKLELALADEKIAFERSARAIAINTFEKQKNYLATLKADGASEDTIKKQEEVVKAALDQANKQTKAVDAAKQARVDIAKRQEVEVTQAATDGADKRREQAKQDAEKAQSDAKELAQKRLEFDKETNELAFQNSLDQIKDEFEKRRAETQHNFENETKDLKEQLDKKQIDQTQYDAKLEQLKIQNANNIAAIQSDEDKKALEKAKEFATQQEAIDDLIQENRINSIKDAGQRRDAQVDADQQKEIDKLLADYDKKLLDKDQYEKKRLEIEEKYRLIRQGNTESDATKDFNDDVNKLNKDIENNDLAFKTRKDAVDAEKLLLDKAKDDKILTEEQYTKAIEDNTAKRKAINRAELLAKLDYVKQFASILGGLSDVIGRGTKLGKKAAIAGLLIDQGQNVARITMNTIDSTKAIATKYAKIPGGQIPAAIEIGLNIAQGAISIAKSVQAVKKGIADINAAGGGGSEGGSGGGGGGGDMSTGGAGTAPIPPQAEQTALPQDQINQLATANAATRAYVLESDVTGNQERITRINRAARIN